MNLFAGSGWNTKAHWSNHESLICILLRELTLQLLSSSGWSHRETMVDYPGCLMADWKKKEKTSCYLTGGFPLDETYEIINRLRFFPRSAIICPRFNREPSITKNDWPDVRMNEWPAARPIHDFTKWLPQRQWSHDWLTTIIHPRIRLKER